MRHYCIEYPVLTGDELKKAIEIDKELGNKGLSEVLALGKCSLLHALMASGICCKTCQHLKTAELSGASCEEDGQPWIPSPRYALCWRWRQKQEQ